MCHRISLFNAVPGDQTGVFDLTYQGFLPLLLTLSFKEVQAAHLSNDKTVREGAATGLTDGHLRKRIHGKNKTKKLESLLQGSVREEELISLVYYGL